MTKPSETRIANRALVLLGTSEQITSIDDAHPIARAAKANYAECKRELLECHPWNFAIKRASLPAAADNVVVGTAFARAYKLPGDCLRWFPWATSHPDYFEAVNEGRYLLTDAEAPIVVRYMRDDVPTPELPPAFAEALAAKLAMWMAPAAPVQSTERSRDASAIYEEALRRAKRLDGMASGRRDDQGKRTRSRWLKAREARS